MSSVENMATFGTQLREILVATAFLLEIANQTCFDLVWRTNWISSIWGRRLKDSLSHSVYLSQYLVSVFPLYLSLSLSLCPSYLSLSISYLLSFLPFFREMPPRRAVLCKIRKHKALLRFNLHLFGLETSITSCS